MDKSRWLISYWCGMAYGLSCSYVHGWGSVALAFGYPLAAMLIEVYRSEHQNSKGGW